MIAFTASQRAVLAEHGIATSNRGVIARVVAVFTDQDAPPACTCLYLPHAVNCKRRLWLALRGEL